MPKKSSPRPRKQPVIPQTVVHPDAAGIDLAAEVHYVAVSAGRDPQPVRSFGTTTDQLCVLADWLQECGIRTVAMEATGVYWIPLFELLEARGLEMCPDNDKITSRSGAMTVAGGSFSCNEGKRRESRVVEAEGTTLTGVQMRGFQRLAVTS